MGSVWRNLAGVVGGFFRLGLTGPRLKNSSGVLAVRNAGDSADAALTAGAGTFSGLLALDATDGVTGFSDKGGQVFNVRSYGALGDGTTDDTTAFAAAVTAAAGGTVYVPPTSASYILDNLNITTAKTRLVGAGVKSLLKKKTGTGNLNIVRANAADVVIENLGFDGNSFTNVQCVLIGGSASRVIIRGNNMLPTGGYGIYVNNAAIYDILICNNTVSGNGYGFLTHDNFVGGRLAINDNLFIGGGTTGDAIEVNTPGTPLNVSSVTNATPPVVTTSSAHGYSTGNKVILVGTGATALNGKPWTITFLTTTTFSLDGGTASGVGGAAGTVRRQGATDVTISGNVCTGYTGTGAHGLGIAVAHVRGAAIVGNVVTACNNDGIHVEDGSVDVAVTGNRVQGCARGGITVLSVSAAAGKERCEGVAIVGNAVAECATGTGGTGGISVETGSGAVGNRGVLIADNTVRNCGSTSVASYGIYTHDSSRDVEIRDNLIANQQGGRTLTNGYVNDGTNSTSLSVLYSATAAFTSTDHGRPVIVYTAGRRGKEHVTTVVWDGSSTSTKVSLAHTCITGGSNLTFTLGVAAIHVGAGVDVRVSGNRGYDDQTTKTQTLGLQVRGTQTGFWSDDNDFSGCDYAAGNTRSIGTQTWRKAVPRWFNARQWGAAGGGRRVLDAAVTSGAATVTSQTAAFTSDDIGKTIELDYAGASSALLCAKITAVGSATSCTIDRNAGSTVTGKQLVIGATDDTDPIQACIDAAYSAGGGTVYLPAGLYYAVGLTMYSNITLRGDGPNATFLLKHPGSTSDVIKSFNFDALTGKGANKTLTGATNASPISVTSTAHGYATGMRIIVSGVLGNTNANGRWTVTVVDANTFTLNGSAGNAAYTSGGTAGLIDGIHSWAACDLTVDGNFTNDGGEKTTLTGTFAAAATTMPVAELSGFAASGSVIVLNPGAGNAEVVTYTGRSAGSGAGNLTGCTRAAENTVDQSHASGESVFQRGNGYGLRVFGYHYRVENVRLSNCVQGGLYSEWSQTSDPPYPESMTSYVLNADSHQNGGHGVYWNGPHDSLFSNCSAWSNNGIGFHIDGESTGTNFQNCHGYGTQLSAWSLDANVNLAQCIAEGGVQGQIRLHAGADNVNITGANVFDVAANSRKGVVLVSGASLSGLKVDAQINHCTGGAIDFAGDAGENFFNVTIYQTTGTVFSGTVHAESLLNYLLAGTTTATTNAPVLHQGPYARLSGDTGALTSTAAANVTGLSFPVSANSTYEFEFYLKASSSTTAGLKVALTIPASATVHAAAQGTGATNLQSQVQDTISATATLTTAVFVAQIATGWIRIKGFVTTGATAGTVQLQYAKVTGGNCVFFAGSHVASRRIL